MGLVGGCKVCVLTLGFFLNLLFVSNLWLPVSSLGSMSSIAISYGENGPVFCGLSPDSSHLVSCFGSNSAIIYGSPAHFPFAGLTAGDGFVCGLLMDSNQPYCWGSSSYIQMGVPQPMTNGAQYTDLSAGDYHLCGLRKPNSNLSYVDCWGYNMTKTYVFDGLVGSISAGSGFNCGLFLLNQTVFCWGDETSSRVISLVPKQLRFRKIAAGGYHVCGIIQGPNSRVFCWGRSLELDFQVEISVQSSSSGQGNVDLPPRDPMVSIVGGKFHACGIKSSDQTVICWGFRVKSSTSAPTGVKVVEMASGNYFTCGVLSEEESLKPVCWGLGFPTSGLPVAVAPGLCNAAPCAPGSYEFSASPSPCTSPNSRVCLPCSVGCSVEMYQISECSSGSDRQCGYNCSNCLSQQCSSNCSSVDPKIRTERFWSLQLPVLVAEIVFAIFLIVVVLLIALLYVRYKLRNCRCDFKKHPMNFAPQCIKDHHHHSHHHQIQIRPSSDLDELKIRRAQMFSYKELDRATDGFKEESQVGKGSFSCVFKGVLKDGTVVAVKRAIMSSEKNSKEFRTELDLLSRLNHAHLLNLLGFCEEGGERLLVYEFMAHGSLHQHLHDNKEPMKMMDWVRRVTIAVQTARGIEYLHGYACPPVIHRDIKSSNILIDEEHNARVADFGLSLLGPADSSSPLAELPAGTLGYLDPEYYRLHYLTTKSDVYSFGVLLLEILSGRKAIDMKYEEGNIVEWAVPLIKAGNVSAVLDPDLKSHVKNVDVEALKRIANVACKCVRMRGKDRPSMDKVTTALERALAQLMGSPSTEQPILPTEVVLGSSRLHKKSSSNRSGSETEGGGGGGEDQRFEFRAPSWITFPSVTSSQRRKSSVSEVDIIIEGKNFEQKSSAVGLRSLEEEIGPASPQQNLFLQHNF